MEIKILTLFPQMLANLNHSIIKKAQENDLINIDIIDFRQYSKLKWNRIDDTIFGGGPGMLIMAQPVIEAITKHKNSNTKVIMVTPEGKRLTNKVAKELANQDSLMFVCGHYEGFDARVNPYIDLELSIGDFVLTNGEIAATVCIDAISRFIPGVLGNKSSYEDDSFEKSNLLDYDKYTKPREFNGQFVPDVLLSGNHQKINDWQIRNSIEKTVRKRPDLIDLDNLNPNELKIYNEVKKNDK